MSALHMYTRVQLQQIMQSENPRITAAMKLAAAQELVNRELSDSMEARYVAEKNRIEKEQKNHGS